MPDQNLKKLAEQKQSLRKTLKAKRDSLTATEQAEATSNVVAGLIKFVQQTDSQLIGVYNAIGRELSIKPFIDWLWQNQSKYTCLAPVTNPIDNSIQFYPFSSFADLDSNNKLKIPEPITKGNTHLIPDLIVVPGLAFDQTGNRLGYGVGFYDRYLSNFHGKTIGVCHKVCLIKLVPNEKHDQTVQNVICG